MNESRRIEVLKGYCDALKELIVDFKIPDQIVRKYLSFELAEYVLSDYDLLSE